MSIISLTLASTHALTQAHLLATAGTSAGDPKGRIFFLVSTDSLSVTTAQNYIVVPMENANFGIVYNTDVFIAVYGASSSSYALFYPSLSGSNVTLVTFPSIGQVSLPEGTAALPSLSFIADNAKGIYSTGVNGIGISIAGSSVATITNSAITVAAGVNVAVLGNLTVTGLTTMNDNVSIGDAIGYSGSGTIAVAPSTFMNVVNSSSNITLQLPAPSSVVNQLFVVCKNGSSGVLTVSTADGSDINGASTYTIAPLTYGFAIFYSITDKYLVISFGNN